MLNLRVEGTCCLPITVLDGYSRYVVHGERLASMVAADVWLVIQEALERTGVKPQVVSENGTQFTAGEFKDLVKRFELEHIRIRSYHPESNGTLERYHHTTRDALAEEDSEDESYGNFNYGVVGRAAGISAPLLRRAAGWAQRRAETSQVRFEHPSWRHPYGDDPEDQTDISVGMQYYNSGCWRA
jgi:hypothetical protein